MSSFHADAGRALWGNWKGFEMSMMTKLVSASGGLALALFAGSGIASAAPNVEAIVNSTCTYPQVMAALNVQSPDAASKIQANPMANAWLQSLIAAPPEQRRTMIQQAVAVPEVQQNAGLINQVANTCKNY
jgi:hemophore-related protein